MEMLRAKRMEAHLTQQELSALSGVNQQTISMIESGQRCPNVKLAYKLAVALHCSIEDLIVRADDTKGVIS